MNIPVSAPVKSENCEGANFVKQFSINEKRNQLEASIVELIKEFESETGLKVHAININTVRSYLSKVCFVEADIRLE